MINFLIANKGKGSLTWYEIAEKYHIKSPNQEKAASNEVYNRESCARAARSIWEAYQRNYKSLHNVKETYKNDELVYQTFKHKEIIPEVNTEGFELDYFTVNPYGQPWSRYKKKYTLEERFDESLEKLFDKYKNFKVTSILKQIRIPDENFALVNLYDAHLDKISIKGRADTTSDFEKNLRVFSNTIDDICLYLKDKNCGTIIFPTGNDLFHTNGMNSQTKKGTPIEYLLSPEDAYYRICDLIIESIFKLRTVCNNLIVPMIKGNHDEDKIAVLGYWLSKRFEHDSSVQVDFSRKQRKYIHLGQNLLGFAHGDKEKSKIAQMPLIMATEQKIAWGNSIHRKMYMGDLHHGFEYMFLRAKDFPGAEIEYLRAISTDDAWHDDFSWIGIVKTAYVQIFDYNKGEKTREKFWINE